MCAWREINRPDGLRAGRTGGRAAGRATEVQLRGRPAGWAVRLGQRMGGGGGGGVCVGGGGGRGGGQASVVGLVVDHACGRDADGRVLSLLGIVVVVKAAVIEPAQRLRCWWRREFILLSPPSALRIWSR